MTDPIFLPVATSGDGLELVETLARRGFAATLVSEPTGWRVAIPTRAGQRVTLLDDVSRALGDSMPPLRGPSEPVQAGGVLRDPALRSAVAAPPLRAA